MSRCLSDRALARMLAELAAPAERAHLAVCSGCSVRFRRLHRDIGAIAGVLASTTDAGTQRRPVPWRWRAAAAMVAAASVAGLLWVETTMWTASRSMTDPGMDREIALALEDLWSSVLSTDGESSRSLDPSALLAEAAERDLIGVCDDRSGPDEAGCVDALGDDPPFVDALGSDVTVDAVLNTDIAVQGG